MNSLGFSSISCVSSSPFPVYYVGFPMDMDKVWVLIKYTLQGLETWQSHNISYFRIKWFCGQQTQKKSTDAQSRAKKVHRRCQIAPTKAILKGNHYFILMRLLTSVTHRVSLNFFHRSLKKKRGELNTTTVPSKRSFGSVETQVCLLTVKEFLKNSQEQQVGPWQPSSFNGGQTWEAPSYL